jgi:hypothetical protein
MLNKIFHSDWKQGKVFLNIDKQNISFKNNAIKININIIYRLKHVWVNENRFTQILVPFKVFKKEKKI